MARTKLKVGDYFVPLLDYYTYDINNNHYIEKYESNYVKLARVTSIGGDSVNYMVLIYEEPGRNITQKYKYEGCGESTCVFSNGYYTFAQGDTHKIISEEEAKQLLDEICNNTVSEKIKIDDKEIKKEINVQVKANDIQLTNADIFAKAMSEVGEKLNKLTSQLDENNKRDKKSNETLQEAVIQGIIEKSKEIATEDLKKEIKEELDKFIKETYGFIPTKIDVTREEGKTKTLEGLFHKMYEPVLKLVNMKLPVFLTGPAGTGKNFMVEQIAQGLDLPFYYTSSITQEYKLTGFIDGSGAYHETEFYKAFKDGGVFMLDEMDASIPECLIILNGAIANGYFDFPVGRITAHENFRVVCAGNTVGYGANSSYTGRNAIDGATLDRFVLVNMEYDPRLEEMLCPDNDFRNFIYDVRKAVKDCNLTYIVGMRCLKNGYAMISNGFDKTFILNAVVFKGMPTDDINMIKDKISSSSWKTAIEL